MKFEYFLTNRAGKIRRETADLPEVVEHDVKLFLYEYENLCLQHGMNIVPYCDDGFVDLDLRVFIHKTRASVILDDESLLHSGE